MRHAALTKHYDVQAGCQLFVHTCVNTVKLLSMQLKTSHLVMRLQRCHYDATYWDVIVTTYGHVWHF